MQEKEQKWDTGQEDDKLRGAGITNMITKVINGIVPGQKAREEERDKTARMDGGEVMALQQEDST
jgi:hypothetical protein